jgi:hypothetical protein
MSSGNLELTIDEKIKKYEKELDDIIEKVGISFYKDEASIEALKLSYEQLRDMDQRECCILSYNLQQYGLYIQSVVNRLNSISYWINESINKIVGKNCKNYGNDYTKFEEKKSAIIAENEAANYLMSILVKSSGKTKELYGLSAKINTMAATLLEISKSKRTNNG